MMLKVFMEKKRGQIHFYRISTTYFTGYTMTAVWMSWITGHTLLQPNTLPGEPDCIMFVTIFLNSLKLLKVNLKTISIVFRIAWLRCHTLRSVNKKSFATGF